MLGTIIRGGSSEGLRGFASSDTKSSHSRRVEDPAAGVHRGARERGGVAGGGTAVGALADDWVPS
jgi:hypothetical protein